jgi:hypothetical protein
VSINTLGEAPEGIVKLMGVDGKVRVDGAVILFDTELALETIEFKLLG